MISPYFFQVHSMGSLQHFQLHFQSFQLLQLPALPCSAICKVDGIHHYKNYTESLSTKFAPRELFQSQSLEKLKGLYHGIRFRKIAAEICDEGKRHGADFPCQDELVNFLEILGFKKIKEILTYFECRLVLRTRKVRK